MMTKLRQYIARFRAPLALIVAAAMAAAVWTPVSAAPPAGAHHLAHSSPWLPSLPGLHAAGTGSPHLWSTPSSTSTTSYSLSSSEVKIKTTRGAIRREFIYAYKNGATISAYKNGSTAPVSVDLYLDRHFGKPVVFDRMRDVTRREGGVSTHNQSLAQDANNGWNMGNLRPSELSVHGGNATVSFNSTQVGPFGRLFGTFKATKKTADTCTVSGSEFDYTGTFKVNELFKTKNSLEHHSKLGRVHGPRGRGGTIVFPHASKSNTTHLFVDNACVNKAPPPPTTKTYCETGTTWSSPRIDTPGKFEFISGYKITIHSPNPSSVNTLFAYRNVAFSGLPSTGGYGGTPATIYRFDEVLDNGPAQSYSQQTTSPFAQTETVTAPAGDKFMQGSATLMSAASAAQNNGPCYVGDTAETQYDQIGQTEFTWTNGSTKLTADSAVGRNFTIDDQTTTMSGAISHDTYGP